MISRFRNALWTAPLSVLLAAGILLAGCARHEPIEVAAVGGEATPGDADAPALAAGARIELELHDGRLLRAEFVAQRADSLALLVDQRLDTRRVEPRPETVALADVAAISRIDDEGERTTLLVVGGSVFATVAIVALFG